MHKVASQHCLRVYHCLFAALLLLLCGNVLAASLETEVDRTTVIDGESVVLYINGSGLSEIPDTSILLTDFRIVQSGVSSSQQIVNGVSTRGYKVRLELQPEKTGSVAIPVFTVDGISSEPIGIEVVPRGTPGVEPRDKVFVELVVDKVAPYVQEQVILSLNIFDDGNLASADPTLEGNSNYQVERLPSSGEKIVERDGVQYRRHTFRYAIFPQKSGEVVIDSVSIPASVRDKSYGGNLILRNTPTRRIQLRTEPLSLQVKPRAALSTSGWWLPVEVLQLKHEWSSDIKDAKVGEAFTLTMELIAKGAASSQLPEIPIPDIPGVKIYADTPQFATQPEPDHLLSLRREKWSVIPNKSGKVSLPEINIKWWDTVSDSEKVVSLEAQEIMVQGSDLQADTDSPLVTPEQNLPAETNTSDSVSALKSPDLADPGLNDNSAANNDALAASDGLFLDTDPASGVTGVARWWQWLALVVMAIWALTLFAWWWTSRSKSRVSSATQNLLQRESQAWRRLKPASRQQDPSVYSNAVLEWAQVRWPDQAVHNLPAIGTLLGSQTLTDHMQSLDESRFSPLRAGEDRAFDLRDIHQQLEIAVKNDRRTQPDSSASVLPQLS